jgi:O-antigen ligase
MVTGIEKTYTNTRPYWSLPVLIAVGLTMATSSVVFIEPAPYDLLVMALLGVLMLRGLRFPREMHLAAICIGTFALANLIAAAGSTDPTATFRFLFVRIYLLLTWLLFASVIAASPVQVMRVIWFGYSIAAVLAVVWGALEYFGFIKLAMWEGGLRAKGPFKDPNVFAPFLLPVALYGLKELYASGTLMWRAAHALLFMLIAFGTLISFSRGAWMAFILAFGLFSVFTLVSLGSFKGRLNLMLANMLLVFAAVGILSVAVVTTSVADRFFQRAVISQEYDLQEGGRFYTQQKAIQKIGTTPLGIGPGQSAAVLGIPPHNLYLHVFVESGWIGGLAFFIFLFFSFYRSLALFWWKSPLRGDFFVVFASLSGLLLQSFFIDSTHWRHFWLLLAMNWGLIVAYERFRTRTV